MKHVAHSLIVAAIVLATTVNVATAQRAGGPCTYDKYPGKATITKIVKTDASKQQARQGWPYEGFEIWFTFTPDKPLPAGPWAERVRKPELFQIGSGQYPGEKYIAKYAIKVGKEFPATLSIIKTGTCSPIHYELQGLNRTDFFESQPAPQAGPHEVSWDELKAIIQKGKVATASQTHARRVSVTMEDGQTYHATEPALDDIIKLLRQPGTPHPPIATE